jgi:solute carrier family 35, member F1/2
MEPSRTAAVIPPHVMDEVEKKDDIEQAPEHYALELPEEEFAQTQTQTQRPPIEYHSVGAFLSSVNRRFKSIWTRRFALSFLAGQIVSLCITCTNVTTTELVQRNWSLPTTQTFFL